ncbi:GNAT family N-acetyltransferase [Radicibacter daui]|uniref:GNAT family N-acetyltransferase n=1 Tax=Radicibacter daui TaxID=3064829 RepID=UPI004046BB58
MTTGTAAPPAITYRLATREDLPVIIKMLADDSVARKREAPNGELAPGYLAAFDAIEKSPLNELCVADQGGRIIGCLQLTYIPGISYMGMWRALVEAVRVAPDLRGQGIGGAFMRWAMDRARARGCGMMQLTSNKRRPDAHRFYVQLGFEQSHEGFKLMLG